MSNRKRLLLPFLLLLVSMVMLTCCGGGGGNGNNASTTPIIVVYSTNPAVYIKDVQITENSPSVTGGRATSFAVSPALPAGLSLNPATGVITGTPTVAIAKTTYVVTASNEAGSTRVWLLITTELPINPLGKLGIAREAYGVWDRTGFNTVAQYPFTRGQGYSETWFNVNKNARGSFNWSALDAQLQFADDQNQKFSIQISTVGGAKGSSMPTWIFEENGGGVPQVTGDVFTYGFYLDPEFKVYYAEMVQALARHLRNDVSENLQARIAFVRVDTGATGDEEPYENPGVFTGTQFAISAAQWKAHRLWAFEVYRAAFQDGPGPVIPLLFAGIESASNPEEWKWVNDNVKGGFGAKYAGLVRGHHWNGSQEVSDAFRSIAVDPAAGVRMFSRNEMDQTWSKPFFQLNIRLNMYWAAVEQLHAGLSIWDVTESCLKNTYSDNFTFAFEFFNKWAAELDPITAGGGFSILHEGLDASDTVKFPEALYGNASKGNTQRYTAIVQVYAGQGTRMDDLASATKGQVAQRDTQKGFNDAGWYIVRGNYERFITQINPETTSKGLWRINGPLTSASHPYDRFARGFDHASGKNAILFDINDSLLSSPGQRVQLSVEYLDRGAGQFALQYDAVGNSQKTAFTVTKTNTNTWKTRSVVVTDGLFGNRGPNGADLMLVNLDSEDDIFHGVEVMKLADVNVGTVGKGAVTARNNATTLVPVTGEVMEGQRLELTVSPAANWKFTGWSGALTGTNTRPFLFPTRDTRVTAHFSYIGGPQIEPLFSSDPVSKADAKQGISYSGIIASVASDPNNSPHTFSKVSGPAWLNIAANGTLSGIPAPTDVGLNRWVIRVANSAAGSDEAILLIYVNR